MPVFPGCQDSLQSACASSPSLALSPVTAWGVVYPALYHLSLKPVLHWRGRAESNCRCIFSVRRMEPPCPLPSHASLPCCRCTTSTWVPVFPGRQTETPRFRLAVTTAITTSWLGVVVQDFLPHPTSCVPMILHLARLGIEPSPLADSNHAAHGYHRQMDYAVSTENWRGMLKSNQHLQEGEETESPPACTLQQCRMYARLSGLPFPLFRL